MRSFVCALAVSKSMVINFAYDFVFVWAEWLNDMADCYQPKHKLYWFLIECPDICQRTPNVYSSLKCNHLPNDYIIKTSILIPLICNVLSFIPFISICVCNCRLNFSAARILQLNLLVFIMTNGIWSRIKKMFFTLSNHTEISLLEEMLNQFSLYTKSTFYATSFSNKSKEITDLSHNSLAHIVMYICTPSSEFQWK